MTVRIEYNDTVAFVSIDNPPVNATSQAVRQGLLDAVQTCNKNIEIHAVILSCTGKTFVAGGDIREFDAPPAPPHLPDVLLAIEQSEQLWIAAMHGTVLGGGLELALACHARVAQANTRFGLPEVTLGLIPGAGGTVRLPRLVAPELALGMITGGKPIKAAEALEAGLVDRLCDDNPVLEAMQLIDHKAVATLQRPIQRPKDRAAFEKTKEKIRAKARGQESIASAVTALENALNLSPEAALNTERETFLTLKNSAQSKALRHVFFAERGTLSEARCKGEARTLSHIGVVGGGTMGTGIAVACLLAGYTVALIERDAESAQKACDQVSTLLNQSWQRGIITTEKHAQYKENFLVSQDYGALADTDLVIEAVFEDMETKKAVFAKLEKVTPVRTILATNTSYLDVNEIASHLAEPSRVIGLHFFSPAHIMKLLEIILPDYVADDVVATAAVFARRLRKIAVLSGVCDGFIGNRIMSAYRREAEYLLEDGAYPADIDRAMHDFGFPIGIFQMQDLAGLDISWAMRKRRAASRDPNERYVAIADRLCEAGYFGRKTNKGWYLYKDGILQGENPEATGFIDNERTKKNIQTQEFSDKDIMQRILAALQNEAEKVLSEGIARSAADIDVVMINAYGFPRWTGGPMFMI